MDDTPCGMVEIHTEMLNIHLNPCTTDQVFGTAHFFLLTRDKNSLHALILDNVLLYTVPKIKNRCEPFCRLDEYSIPVPSVLNFPRSPASVEIIATELKFLALRRCV